MSNSRSFYNMIDIELNELVIIKYVVAAKLVAGS